MKRHFAVTLGVMLCACAVLAQPAPQGPGAGQPAQPRSPEVLADGKVVFRLLAPAAAAVTLGGDFPIGTNVAMTKDDKGVWSATVGPLKADFYSYFFAVDGVRTLDWRNVFVMRDGARYASWLRVLGADAADYQVDLTSFRARVTPAYGKYWPITRCQMNAVEVQFVCGYGDATTVNDPAFDGTNYDLEILPNYVVKFGVTDKTETGFHINFDTAAPPDASIDIVASGGIPRQTLLRQTVVIDGDALSADIVFSQTLQSPSTIVGGVPLHLKQALLLLLGDFYENRENSTFAPNITQLPFAFKALVGANRHIQI